VAGIRFEGVTKRFKNGTVAVDDLWLEVPDGEFMVLVGPSGCGKTTALRMIAGFETATEGVIRLGDRVVNDVDPRDRDVAMVFQTYALFPHLTAGENIAFPLKMRGVRKRDAAARVREIADLLGLGDLLERKPYELSGGQRQRVAMGRAIIRHPQAFLMDEPLSNLDAKLRTQLRAELGKLHRTLGVTTLYVTHDQTEAMTLGSRVAVLRDGVVQQLGTPYELYRRPHNAFVARFIGSPPMNLMRGTLHDGALEVPGATGGAPVDLAHKWRGERRSVIVGVRPEAWRTGGERGAVTIAAAIEVVEELGAETMVYFEHGAATAAGDHEATLDAFAARVDGRTRPAPGDRLVFSAAAEELYVFDAETGESLVGPD
jgi:multiple sugar transport system ATP-binding protein